MPYAGDDVAELEARQEPRLVRALEMVAPGTAVREGLDNIVQGGTGALICIGESEELSFLLSGGVKLEVDYTPALLYQLAKMDGAIVLAANATLDKYRSRLDQVSTRLTALEFEGGVTLHDVLTVLQRAELVTRMAVEIERYIVELGTEGRLIEMQLEETMVGAATDAELEAVEGVGDMRARDIREGLRRLQEINLVDRYLQT